MTEPIDGQEKETQDEEEFTPEQQKLVNKIMGKIRIEAREKGKADAKAEQEAADQEAERESMAAAAEWEKLSKMHSDRVTELEPFEAEAKAYRELIKGMLADRIKALGDKAKVIVKAMPESLSDLEKLNWLNKVVGEGAFELETDTPRVGTPVRGKKKQSTGKSERPEGYHRSRI